MKNKKEPILMKYEIEKLKEIIKTLSYEEIISCNNYNNIMEIINKIDSAFYAFSRELKKERTE